MRKQWLSVITIVAGLLLGVYGLVKFGNRSGPIEVGSDAPEVSAVRLSTGDTVSLTEKYRGNVVLVNLWATWCTPCRKEMPAMEKLYQEFAAKGFAIAAVSVDEGDTKDVLAFAEELGLSFDILHDPDGSVQKAYQTIMFPESFLIDRNGVVVKKVIGEHPWSSNASRRTVAELLGVSLDRAPDSAAAVPTPGG
ncbi:MAG: TlpA family protein disulfide reductase [Gemmatimonadetes bacterium]|nr:TlpA family protein disulfide reductase [Gemmatimonadota bacterium]